MLTRLHQAGGNRFVQRLLRGGDSLGRFSRVQPGDRVAPGASRGLLQRQPNPDPDAGGYQIELGEAEIACIFATETPIQNVDTHILFAENSAALTPTAVADIERFVVRWNAAGADQPVRIDAYASVDGPEEHNRSLSCDRAYAVKQQLKLAANGCPGIPANMIEPYAHGETIAFGNALAPNRRATITADLPAASANPATACGGS